MREFVEGITLTQRVFITGAERARMPAMAALIAHPRLNRLMRYCLSKNRRPLYYVENLCNQVNVTPLAFEWVWGKVLARLDKARLASGEQRNSGGKFTR